MRQAITHSLNVWLLLSQHPGCLRIFTSFSTCLLYTSPIVCNTGGYETVESVEAWRGYIDIWLADLKYVSSALSLSLIHI